jgi:hypothetical protein
MGLRQRSSSARATVVLAGVGVLSAALVAAQPSSAAPPVQVNYYTASFTPNLVRYVMDPTQATTEATSVVLSLTNCGRARSLPTICPGTGSPAIKTTSLTLPAGWTAVTPVTGWTAVSNTAALARFTRTLVPTLAAGLTATQPAIQVVPTTTGAGVAQNVALCVSDTTSCLATPPTSTWQLEGAAATLELPLRFTFVKSPIDGTPSTTPCGSSATPAPTPTKVQLIDDPAGSDPVPLQGVGVTLAAASGSLDPSFAFTAANTPLTNLSGLATFPCGSTPAVGGPYRVVAVATTGWPTIPSATSDSFVVYTHLNPCNGKCSDSLQGNGGTEIDTSSDSGGSLGDSVFDFSDQHFSAFVCGMDRVDQRPDVLQAATSDNSNKTVVITWSKDVTHKFTDTGTPHWQVCMQAPATFKTDSGADATGPVNGFWYGTIPICGVAPAGNPCMLLSRNRSMEIATITLPTGWAGDPYFH